MNKPNVYYSGGGNSKGALILPEKGGATLSSPSNGQSIKLTQIQIPSSKVMQSIVKCKYNKRNISYLTPAAVLDILGDIRTAKQNTNPVLAVKLADGRFEVIAGIRRCYAVSLCPDANLVLQYADSMTDADKQILAKTSDIYRAPSLIDFGLTLLDFKKEAGDDDFSVRQVAEAFGENKTLVSDALRAAELPSELIKLFPALEFISRSFLRKVTAKNISSTDILTAVMDIDPLSFTNEDLLHEDADSTIKQSCKMLETKIVNNLSRLRTNSKSHKPVNYIAEEWGAAKFQAGVKAKVSNNTVTLTLDKKAANSELGRALLKLLELN